eukprot:2164691-Ditylum_brightwellii.AAC.1
MLTMKLTMAKMIVDEDNDVGKDAENGEDDSVGNGDHDGADDGADGAEKHLVYLSQVADCCWVDRSKQNKHLVGDEDKDVGHEADD